MANGKTHLMVGAGVALIADTLWQRAQMKLDPEREFDWAELVIVGVCGAGVGILADVLEPATDPNHRGFFHSIFFYVLLLWAFTKFTAKLAGFALYLGIMLLCYCSHLFLDSLTPRGLPLLGRWRCW
jgi:inner membrane protein